ncbi:choline dehydrogenase [Hypoxylon sp. FL1857]|nr:choline dehydrogenase [Hypoxylon sp. FL1857]
MSTSLSALVVLFALSAAALAAPVANGSSHNYVLIGGGAAGFVLAEYLTRDPSVHVVLLEAGPDSSTNPLVTTPADFVDVSEWLWNYTSQPDPNLDGLTPDLVQGRCLGGGTGVNAMYYCRGSASVFDEWAEISGNQGLGWESMLESFKATTHWRDAPFAHYDQPLNTSAFGDGPLEITRQRQLLTLDEPFANTMASTFGLSQIDFVSGQGIGVTQSIESIRASNETRSYSYNTFGYLANDRPNFELHQDAWVSKIGFTGTTADSVTYNDTTTGTMHTIEASEVIVTAGTINSPQLLMLSGVGPRQHLEELGIDVVIDIPQVGQNLFDHHYAVVQYEATADVDSDWQLTENATRAAIEEQLYASNGDGLLGTIVGDVMGAYRLPDAVFNGTGDYYQNLPSDRPHIAYYQFAGPFLSNSPNVSIVSGFSAVVQPEASGNVTLASANYLDSPLIFSNYYGSAGDRAAILSGYRGLRELFQSAELSAYTTRELFPGPEVNSNNDTALWAAIQQGSRTWHHPVGTTAIGTVLDANWRVKGLQGLRVVGASSAPTIPTCPIEGAVYAMSHRAALDIAAADGLNIA